MAIREFCQTFNLEDALGLSSNATVVDFLPSEDGSAKIVQAVYVGEGHGVRPDLRVTFETGRYFVDDEEKICLSCQIGCGMGCRFCETGEPYEYAPSVEKRLMRNLTAEEIVAQAKIALWMVPPDRSKKLVYSFMGMGEVGANFKEVDRAIGMLAELKPFYEQMVTVSTIGSNLEAISKLKENVISGKYEIPVRLHVSLHASNKKDRHELMPAARSIEDVLHAAESFAQATDTDVKLNYTLVSGYNDRDENAEELARLLEGRSRLIVKVSRLNPHGEFCPTEDEQTERFIQILEEKSVPVYRFQSMGTDVEAGCGEFAKGKREETVLVQVMRVDGKYLVLKRAGGRGYGESWSLVSGLMETGETVEDATCRETLEETGIDLRDLRPMYQRPFQYVGNNGLTSIVHPCVVMVGMDTIVDLSRQENPENSGYEWIDYREFFGDRSFAEPLREELERFLKERTRHWDEYQRWADERYPKT